MNKRRCRISFSVRINGQLEVAAFDTFFPEMILDDSKFFDTVVSEVFKFMHENDVYVEYEDVAILGWSFYD